MIRDSTNMQIQGTNESVNFICSRKLNFTFQSRLNRIEFLIKQVQLFTQCLKELLFAILEREIVINKKII